MNWKQATKALLKTLTEQKNVTLIYLTLHHVIVINCQVIFP